MNPALTIKSRRLAAMIDLLALLRLRARHVLSIGSHRFARSLLDNHA